VKDEAVFLDAIRANLEDIAARLVYADWLEERGDPRGEYLRLEIEAARIQTRLDELRPNLAPDWLHVTSYRQLRYNVAYHQHCQLRLRSGRTVTLETLAQGRTYAGLLAGTPSQNSNDHHINSLSELAESYCVAGARSHLIVPPRRNYFRKPGDMERFSARSPHRVPEWLPMVWCIGSFNSVVKARDPSRDMSVMTVVWFQDEYALPIQQPALGQLQELDWEALAVDVDI
jgi:uncharacterized protein (TIGR02996 family)